MLSSISHRSCPFTIPSIFLKCDPFRVISAVDYRNTFPIDSGLWNGKGIKNYHKWNYLYIATNDSLNLHIWAQNHSFQDNLMKSKKSQWLSRIIEFQIQRSCRSDFVFIHTFNRLTSYIGYKRLDAGQLRQVLAVRYSEFMQFVMTPHLLSR